MSEPRVYAWTPGAGAYKSYPQYANFKLFEDGRCTVTVRAPEFRTVGEDYYQMGETVCIQLPPEQTAELIAFFASADTHPKDGDAQQAPLVSGAVARDSETDAQPIPSRPERLTHDNR